MPSVADSGVLLDAAIDEFAAEVRRGGEPSVEDYVARFPQCTAELRRLLPTVRLMERCGRAPAPVAECVPDRVGDYEIVREIGRGGMGVVYEACDATSGARVALKVLRQHEAARADRLARFRREAEAAARLEHPHIVRVLGAGESRGEQFLAMQYVDGPTLAELCRRRCQAMGGSAEARAPLDFAWTQFVARVGKQAGAALAYAHAQGVLHRDVKPSNLLVDAAGGVWVADFGLAKADGLGDLTATGDVPGTVRYLAPERLAGRADARSDVFSLGLVLYELLCGRPAFDAVDRLATLRQVEACAPPRPRRLVADVSRRLEAIVRKCLERDPARRYATAAKLAVDCQRYLEGRRPVAAAWWPPTWWHG
jgi:serine/threonine protein kinase